MLRESVTARSAMSPDERQVVGHLTGRARWESTVGAHWLLMPVNDAFVRSSGMRTVSRH